MENNTQVEFMNHAGNFLVMMEKVYGRQLSTVDRQEFYNILENKSAKDCEQNPETVRQRRKRLYARLALEGADDLKHRFTLYLVDQLIKVTA